MLQKLEVSIFADEISPDLDTQVAVLREMHINRIDFRKAFGRNVSMLSDEEIDTVRTRYRREGIEICCLASPVGKKAALTKFNEQLGLLYRMFEVGRMLGTSRMRIFGFRPTDEGVTSEAVAAATDALHRFAEAARQNDFVLLLEGEPGLCADTPEHCHEVLSSIDSPHLRFVWDSGNFLKCGIRRPVEHAFELLRQYTSYVHIKDMDLETQRIVAAGEGDGQIWELLKRVAESRVSDIVSLEPNRLVYDGPSIEEDRPGAIKYAARALYRLLDRV